VQVKLADGSPLGGIVAVAASWYHTVALRADGSVWAWGDNIAGQLGDGSNVARLNPVQAKLAGGVPLGGITAVAASGYYSVALKSDGSVWAWGNNAYGQLGDGTITDRYRPVPVSGLLNVTAIAGGVGHTVALRADGTAWAWGYNFFGQLGDGTTVPRLTPVPVKLAGGAPLFGITAIAAGKYHTLALKGEGTVWLMFLLCCRR
jgi:alpha-tubulin suppressor-like RCC1 family protein